MITRFASLALLVSVFAAFGCSSSSSADDAPSEDVGALENSHTAEGAFTVSIDGHKVKMGYQLGKFDLTAKTAVWSAQVLDDGGHPNMSDDKNVASKITRVARCAGCFTVEVPGGRDGGPLAVVNVSEWAASSIQYEAKEATLLDAEEEANNAGGNAGNANDIGACTMSCSGSDSCKPNVKRSECNVESGLFPRLRCPTTFSFVKGGTCPR